MSVHRAPDFGPGGEWIDQAAPHHISDYRGHVVLIDFWEYTCINCIRDFAVLKRWYAKYHSYGLDIVGIHFGEFNASFNVDNVRAAAQRFQLPWPVYADQQGTTWKAYAANGWPTRYVIGPQGNIVMKVFGEGSNRELETKIRQVLATIHPEAANVQLDSDEDEFRPECGIATPETYLGQLYGNSAIADLKGHHAGDEADFLPPHSPADGQVMLAGRWRIDKDGVTSQSKDSSAEVRYHARSLYAVLSRSGTKPLRVNIFEDGVPLPHSNGGADVKFDASGAYLEVTDARMYYIVRSPAFSAHLIALQPEGSGLTVNSITYGNNCQLADKP